MEIVSTESRDDVRHEIDRQTCAHMIEVVNSTPVEREPFPHFVAHGIFPAAVYEEMLARLPEESLYDAFTPGKPKAGETKGRGWSGDRGRFKLTDASIERLTGRQRSFWLGVRDALEAPAFKAAVYERLRPGLSLRFGSRDVAELPGHPVANLLREASGYAIKPHPDTSDKLVTMQIALPADGSQENLGTQFYRRSSNPLRLLREPSGFEVSKQIPFLPNVAYAFAVIDTNTLKSWHGRTTLKRQAGVRNTILLRWWDKPRTRTGVSA